jgi:UDP-hydrolysing UDP-N-acetyl-D-glucosamine 2-epimerase
VRRELAVLTTGRQDYGILRPVCLELLGSASWRPRLVVGGMHLDPRRGELLRLLSTDGLEIAARLEGTSGEPAAQAAATLAATAAALEAMAAQALLVVGDRSETAAAALGAVLARVPIVHLHGGEETEGAIDNALRHAITKLSHLHLVSHEDHARRVRQMGEPDEAVIVVGAPGLDNLRRPDLPDRAALERSLGLALAPPVVAVTFHPTTLGGDPGLEAAALVDGLERLEATYVVALPNNDPGGEIVREALLRFSRARPRRIAVEALGPASYFGLLGVADAMVGNSSSGLIEAPIFELPVVNVGERQRGRLRGANVIDAPADAVAIADALGRALAPPFRASLRGTTSPYGDGRSAPRVRAALEAWTPPNPPRKRFVPRA